MTGAAGPREAEHGPAAGRQGGGTSSAGTLPLHLGALTTAPHNPALRAGLDELLAEVHRLLAGQIAEPVGSGDLPPWVEPEAMAHLLLALLLATRGHDR